MRLTSSFVTRTITVMVGVLALPHCMSEDNEDAGEGSTPASDPVGAATSLSSSSTSVRFRSDVLLPLAATNPADCANNKNAVFPAGVRPLCAATNFDPAAVPMCRIVGLNAPTCDCFEGQAHACDVATGGPCTAGANCGVIKCLASDDTHSMWTGCLKTPMPHPTTTAPPSTPPFRSDTLLPMSVTNPADCANNKSPVFPTARRPLCAATTYTAGGTPQCQITGLQAPTCACWEGQAHACDLTTGGPCTAGGQGCGVMKCSAADDTHSVWSACSYTP